MSDLFARCFGIEVVPSTFVRAQKRLGGRVEPICEELKLALRQQPVVYPDETGWRIAACSAWLWVFVSEGITIYVIRLSRGQDVIEEILGLDYHGTVGHDGRRSYGSLTEALHQTGLGHLLRRCERLLETWRDRAEIAPVAFLSAPLTVHRQAITRPLLRNEPARARASGAHRHQPRAASTPRSHLPLPSTTEPHLIRSTAQATATPWRR